VTVLAVGIPETPSEEGTVGMVGVVGVGDGDEETLCVVAEVVTSGEHVSGALHALSPKKYFVLAVRLLTIDDRSVAPSEYDPPFGEDGVLFQLSSVNAVSFR